VVSSLQADRLKFEWIFLLSHRCYIYFPSNHPWFDHLNDTWFW
jgi:hypothetical protein